MSIAVPPFAEFINAIPEDDWSWYEYQAYSFGGLLLVPRDPLRIHVDLAIARAKERGFAQIDPTNEAHRGYLAQWVSKVFEVSPGVILKRGGKDGLWPTEP
jgi:hypothetical protein